MLLKANIIPFMWKIIISLEHSCNVTRVIREGLFLWAVQIIVHRKPFTEAHWHLFNTLTGCSPGRHGARTQQEHLTSYISKLKALGDDLVELPGNRRCPV